MYPSEEEAAEQICAAGKMLYERRFVASNDGNISMRIGDDRLFVTPTGISKGALTPETLILCDLAGNQIERGCAADRLKASSETKMHLAVYRTNPTVRAVVHAHPPYATAFATAGLALDKPIYPQAFALLGMKGVPCTPYAVPGTDGVPESVIPYCGEDSGYNALLLGNHGALSWGVDMHLASFRMETTESYAQLTMFTQYIIGKYNEIPPIHF